jgi:8-oxo-dGTP diphosphatase
VNIEGSSIRMPDRSAKQIGVAIVEFNGRYLVGTRQEEQDLAGLAEFPGGKCESGESPADCAVRECREETGLCVFPIRLLKRTYHEYAHTTVDLHFWLCRVGGPNGEPPENNSQPTNGFQWKGVDELRELSFPEANASVVQTLISGTETTGKS